MKRKAEWLNEWERRERCKRRARYRFALWELLMGAVIIFAVGYLVLQVGRWWGKQEAFWTGRDYGVAASKMELRHSILTERTPFWFGEVHVDPAKKRMEVKN